MAGYWPSIGLLFVAALSLATWLEPWFQNWAGNRAGSADLLRVMLGDGRRLFARHVYAKADAYFHSGYYPSIYDQRPASNEMHMAADASARDHGPDEEPDFLGKSRDWLDAFSRHFYPAAHKHLGETSCAGCAGHGPGDHEGHECSHEHEQGEAAAPGGEERELLPWLRLAATLDPERPETYVVASYWLRSRLGKVDEAERFLREGLQANPQDAELLFELGRIYRENRNDAERARNVWELALRRWKEQETRQQEPNRLLYAQILGNLAKLEEAQGQPAKAIEYLQLLQLISPNKEGLQKWIEQLKANAP